MRTSEPLTAPEAAKVLGLRVRAVQRLVARGDLRAGQHGRALAIASYDVHALALRRGLIGAADPRYGLPGRERV